MNLPTESKATSTGSPDELAKKYLELAHTYKRLELLAVRLKTEFELIVRHVDSLPVRDENTKKFVLKRLQDALRSFENEFQDLNASISHQEKINS